MSDEYEMGQIGGELNESSIIFPVSSLHIQLDTNIDGVKLFKRSMIKLPKTSRVPLLTSEYPFFTRKIRYPASIQNAPWQTRYEFFFNRDIFIDTLRKAIVKTPQLWITEDTNPDVKNLRSNGSEDVQEKKKKQQMQFERELEIHNIMITLRSILPIREVFRNALKNTYEHVLHPGKNSRVVFDMSTKSAVNVFGFMYKFGIVDRAKSDYFINLSGKRYLVEDVTWENDVVNHPEYLKFLTAYHDTFEEVGKSKDDVKTKLDTYLADFDKLLNKMAVDNFAIPEFYDWILKESAYKDFSINFNPRNAVVAPNLSDDEKKSIAIKHIRSLQLGELITRIKNSVDTFGSGSKQHQKEAPLVKLLYKNYYCKTDNCDDPIWKEVDAINISGWDSSKTKPDGRAIVLYQKWKADNKQDAMIKKLAETLKTTDVTIQTILYNLISNKPASTDERNADRAAMNDRIAEKIKRLFGNFRLQGQAAADTIMAIQLDIEDHQAIKRDEDIKVFINGEYTKAFNLLLNLAVQVNASSIVYDFASKYVPMILTDKQLDGTDERPIIKRRNKFIRDNFGTEASINNNLSESVKNVFEPLRKTSNTELYKLLKRIRIYTPPDPYETEEQKLKREKEADVFRQIYEKYISTYKDNVTQSDIEPYLYTGVEEVKSAPTNAPEPQTEKDKSPPEIQRNAQEIYVRLDLVDAEKMKSTSKAPCKYYDKMLENEYLYLTDKRNKGISRLSKYRDFVFDQPNPLSELAMVAAEEVKNKTEDEAIEKKQAEEKKQTKEEPKKKGGEKYTRKHRRPIFNRSFSAKRSLHTGL